MKTLRETVEIYKGRKAPEVFGEPQSDTQRYLQIEDLRPDASIKYARDSDGVLANNDDVIIAWDGANAGTVSFGLAGYIGSTLAILRPKGRDVYAPFLGYFLQTKFNYLRDNTTGATIPHVNRNALEELALEFPSLPEQLRIAALLDKADHLRRTRRYAAQLSDTFLQAVFVQMFGDPVRNPMGWDIVELAETFSQKPQIGSAVPAQETGEQIVIRVGEIGENRDVSLGRCRRLTLEGKDLERFRVIPGDFLLARAIGSEEHLGKASILQPTDEVVVYDSHVMRLRFQQTIVHPVFFLEWLKSKGGRNRFMQRAGRTAVQFNVNTEQISEVAIPLPPNNLQLEFVKVANQFERLRAQQREAERQAEHLFQALLQKSFR
ncbi:MAG: restriction endonuclease subunit S [Chloroflexi bacterium]|nr:restriction endonuclease subunit S [Chloroflexota bacterium]